jgi:DNA-binding IclR family transcriptional regulator
MNDERTREIKSVDRALRLIETLKSLDGAGVSELAEEVGLTKGAVHTHLQTLEKHGWVQKTDGTYKLGLQLVPLGEHVRNREILYVAGRSEIEDLAGKTGEYAHLVTLEGNYEVTLHEAAGSNAVAPKYHLRLREQPQNLHITASGKAMLAFLPRERTESIIDSVGLHSETEKTITSRSELFDELDGIRERGYAINDEEETPGICSIGSPISTTEGDVLGAVSLSLPSNRLSEDRIANEYPSLVMETSNVIEVNIETAPRSLDFEKLG